MKKRRTRRILLLAIVLFISIGFAVLSSSTSINGLFNFTQNSWSIVFKNVVVDDTSVTKTAPTINQIRTMDGKLKLLNFQNIQNSINYFNNINHFFKCQNEIIQGIQTNLHKFKYNITLA